MKQEDKEELAKEIIELIESENAKDKSNHRDLLEYFFRKRTKTAVDCIEKIENYIKENKIPEDTMDTMHCLIDEIKFLRQMVIDDINKILSNHGDLSITQFEIEKERKEMEYKVIFDPLTSLNTRDYAMSNLRKAIMSFSRKKDRVFTLMMLDVDHFKKVNDTYGHVVGDDILKIVGQTLNMSIRESDVAGRFGGEEFIIILTDTDIKLSLVVADRIKTVIDCIGKGSDEKKDILSNLEKKSTEKEIKNLNRILDTIEAPMKGYSKELITALEKMTISIGITQIIEDDGDFFREYGIDKTILRLIDRADKALYHSKQQGRNSVSIRLPEKRLKEIFGLDQCSVLINNQ